MNDQPEPEFDPFGRHGKRPTVATDCVIVYRNGKEWRVLLIERGHEPFKGMWAFPGGFMEWGESCEESAARELMEETALTNVKLELLGVFSKPGRDPRGTIVSVAYLGIIDAGTAKHAVGGDDAARSEWFDIDTCPSLAADHDDMLEAAKKMLREKKL